MKRTLWSMLLLFTLTHAQVYKVVFDLQTGDENTIRDKVVKNITKLREHYRQQGDTLKVAVVISGDAYRFFIEDLVHSPYSDDTELRQSQPERSKMLQNFAKKATIEMCGMGMKHRHIDPKTLYPFVTPAFNRTDALIRFQSKGYAYIIIK